VPLYIYLQLKGSEELKLSVSEKGRISSNWTT
jgi:hypothetical protein